VDFVFNIAKGRVAEFYNRVDSGDPGTSRLTIVVLLLAGLEAEATLKDHDTLSALLAGTSDEATNTGYARKTIVAGDIISIPTSPSPDDANERMDLDIPDQTWTAVAAAPGAWSKLLVCYNPTAGADNTIIPLTGHDFAVTPDTSNITAVIAAAGFFRAA
jgi:hypothetical protein